jgi:FkbM family methyltransferase
VKQFLLSMPFGRSAIFLRDKVVILKDACFSLEEVGTTANDLLATILITKICGSHKTFIDVGAHIGSIIAKVRHNDSSTKIIAIEAIPQKVKNLQRRFPFVEVHCCAVGETTREVAFFVDTERSGYSTLARPINTSGKPKIEIRVPMQKLDDLVNAIDVDAIKIDVEGAELGVLRGAVNILRKCRPIIMFESAPQTDNGLGYTKEAIFEFLTSADYCLVVPNRVAQNDAGLTLTGFSESHLYPRRTTNYFAIPSERRSDFRDRARSILRLGGS